MSRRNRQATRLVQARVPLPLFERLNKAATTASISMAQLVVQMLQEAEMGRHSLPERVRAIEVALTRFGVVPAGVRQPTDKE